MSSDDSDGVLVEHPAVEGDESTGSSDAAPDATAATNDKEAEPDKKEPKTEEEKPPPLEVESKKSGSQALQIVKIGNEEDAYAFHFNEEALNLILCKIPPGWKVCIVSVVGAFRTGKSFLLSWFLRYLSFLDGTKHADTSEEDEVKWYHRFETLGKDGFDWRGGSERNTTGIWMWSEPHFFKKSTGEQSAVLLVDTQGMFDHETTMALTASIFGLSTLLSSYQIYNVDKRIQEDNLQQLALFSEYARAAMLDDADHNLESTSKPFQQIEFLVRDWQNFEEEDGNIAAMEKEMEEYFKKVIAERDAKDLKETREQILGCFEKITCYGLPHPGMAVTKKKYDGQVKQMDEEFLLLLDRYCARVFDFNQLTPKVIHDRELTAVELGSYIKAYAALFDQGAKFPEAATLLEATAQANNTNAIHLSIAEYKDEMDRIAGPNCDNYVRPEELEELHRSVMTKSLHQFKSIANFGNQRNIDSAREKLLNQMGESFVVYNSLNEGRNPLSGLEIYFVPAVIAFFSWLLRFLADNTCSSWSTYCRKSSDFFGHMFAVVFCFICILAVTKAKQISELWARIKKAIDLFMNADGQGPKRKKD